MYDYNFGAIPGLSENPCGPYGYGVDEYVTEDWIMIVFNATLSSVISSAGSGFSGTTPTATAIQTVDATGHFDLIYMTEVNDPSPGGVASMPYKVRIQSGDQQDQGFMTMNNEFILNTMIAGTAQRPGFIGGRRRFRANTDIIVEFALINSAYPAVTDWTLDVQLVMHGIKVRI